MFYFVGVLTLLQKNYISKVLLGFIFFLLFIRVSFSQKKSENQFDDTDSLQAAHYHNIADSLFLTSYGLAIPIYQKAAETYHRLLILEKKEVWAENLILCLIVQAFAYKELDQYDKAIDLSNKALLIALDNFGEEHVITGNVYDSFGHAYYGEGSYDLSLKYYQKSLRVRKNVLGENHSYIAYLNNSLGSVALDKGEIKLAEEYFKIALNIWKHNFGENHLKVAVAFNNLGLVYAEYGMFEKALLFFEKSIRIRERLLGDKDRFLIEPYRNMGAFYTQTEDFEKALFYYFKAEKIILKTQKKETSNLGMVYHNIGEVYLKNNELTNSTSFFTKALQIKHSSLNKSHHLLASTYSSLGEIYKQHGDYDQSISHFYKALSIDTITFQKHERIADHYLNIGNVLIHQEKYAEAEIALEKAIGSNILGESNNNIYIKGVFSNEYYSLSMLLKVLHAKAVFLSKKEDNANKQKALNTFLMADSVISHIRKGYLKQRDLFSLSKKTNRFYQDALHFINDILQTGSKDDSMKIPSHSLEQLAFYFIERGKSTVLFNMIKTTQVKHSIGISAPLLAKELNIKSKRAFYTQKLNENPEKENRYHDMLFQINQEYDSLISLFQHKYPNYFNLIHNANLVSVEDLKRQLPDDISIIEYFLLDTTIYTLVISNEKITMSLIPFTDSIISSIKIMNKSIQSKNVKLFTDNSHALYSKLIQPLQADIKGNRLIIIPDDVLWHINFDLLLTSKLSKSDYRNLDYLLKDYAISYGYSANMLFQETPKKKNKNKKKQLLLAFSFSNSDDKKSSANISLSTLRSNSSEDLPGSREEIRAISDIFDGQYYYGQLANEANFKAIAQDYSILHLALHGEIDDVYPDNSRLHFTQNKDSLEDSYLYAYELYNMSLNADLAVLSACNTGSGKLVKGEGIMSLGRAFTYAGCKSLVLTQWEVPDDTTPQIMKDFYQGLKDGLNKDEALRQAKLNHLAKADKLTANPFYWGSFVLLGDSSAIDLEDNNNNIIYSLIILLLVSVAFIFIRNKRLKSTA